MRIELEATPEGTLLGTFDQHGKAARNAAGWHTCLDALGAHPDGRPHARESMSAWTLVHPRYVERFGADAATIGPPAGA